MIDAATIGITLALNNGVSDGIAQIRRELAALDAAVAVSSAGLTALATQGAGLAAPARAVAALLPAQPRTAPMVAREDAASPSAPEPAVVAIAMAAMPAAPRPQSPEAQPADVPVATPPPNFASFGRALSAAPGEDVEGPFLASRRNGPTVAPVEAGPPDGQVPSASMPSAPMPSAPVTDNVLRQNSADPPASRPASAPMVVTAPIAAASPIDLPGPLTREDATRAERGGNLSGPIEIILDGTVLARWLNHELATEASRPPAGATAFDPRLSPGWTPV